jgi:hypothetical protein
MPFEGGLASLPFPGLGCRYRAALADSAGHDALVLSVELVDQN